ncbi:MAG: hypothetical protein AB7Q29_15000 [Vicinamibacterales bacterium]
MTRSVRKFAIVDGCDADVRFVSHIGTDWRDDPTCYDPAGELLGGRPWPARMALTFDSYAAAAQHLRARGMYVTAAGFYIVRIV